MKAIPFQFEIGFALSTARYDVSPFWAIAMSKCPNTGPYVSPECPNTVFYQE